MNGLLRVDEFVRKTNEDITSPTTSDFVALLPYLRNSVSSLEEVRERHRESLSKLRKAVKTISTNGNVCCESHTGFSRQLAELYDKRDCRHETSEALVQFSTICRQLNTLMKSLNQLLNSHVLSPLDALLKGDLKCAKGDLKRHIDRAWKEYECKFVKIEKEKLRQAREAGLFRSEVSAADLADVMDHERRVLQLSMCDYLLKVNEINTGKEVDLLQNLIDYHGAQYKYFQSGVSLLDQYGTFVHQLSERIAHTRAEQQSNRKSLLDLKALLQQSHAPDTKEMPSSPGYSLHRPVGDKTLGYTRYGFLMKKSEGKVRKKWQKRRSEVRDGYLYIWHSDETKAPTKFNLLTCHVRTVPEDRRSFDLISFDRTYHLQAEDECDRNSWVTVLLNCRENALQTVFEHKSEGGGGGAVSVELRELQQSLIGVVLRIPGNSQCVDCSSERDVTWLSTNFGILMCIECSGIHRDLGVHISRVQSLTLDHVGTSQLLLSRVLGNLSFNEIMEATLLPDAKLKPSASMEKRCAFIRAKYVERRYVEPTVDASCQLQHQQRSHQLQLVVQRAVCDRNVHRLLQAFAEGAQLGAPLVSSGTSQETALHLAIKQEVDNSSLYIVDFLVQNAQASALAAAAADGNTPLHYCAIYNRPECMKLMLRSGVSHSARNNSGLTALDIATQREHTLCRELILYAEMGRTTVFDNVQVNLQAWCVSALEEGSTDFSDDDAYTTDERSLLHACPSVDSVASGQATNRSPSNHMLLRSPRHLSDSSDHPHPHPHPHPHHHQQQQQLHCPSPPPPAAAAAAAAVSAEAGLRRCRALYDCQADNDDELTFREGETIVIVAECTEDAEWMQGYVEGEPHRCGVFPVSFVNMVTD